MNIWLVILLGGLLTFGMRFSFIYLSGILEMPAALTRALRFVPPAVLSALIAPELLRHEGAVSVSPDNIRLLAGLVAILVAWFSRSTLATILAGIVVLLGLQALTS